MYQNDELERWLMEKRKLAPPSAFSQRVMASVEQSVESRRPVAKATPHPRLEASQSVWYWLTSAAVIVCVMRTACFLLMIVAPTREHSLIVKESISEMPNVK
jgi:hypothetical protein